MMDTDYVDEYCTSCGTSPCSHPDMGTALALAERDRFAKVAQVLGLLCLLQFLLLLMMAGGVV